MKFGIAVIIAIMCTTAQAGGVGSEGTGSFVTKLIRMFGGVGSEGTGSK